MPKPANEVMLRVVEDLIGQQRAREAPQIVILTLKALGAELRARSPGAAAEAFGVIARAVEDNQQTSEGNLQRIGQALVGHWPVVRRALEQQIERDRDVR